MIDISKILDNVRITNQETKKRISDIFSFLYVKIYFTLAILVNIAIWLISRFIDVKIDETQIPLHYNVDFGIDYYGDIKQIYIIPLLGLIFIFFNLVLILVVDKHRDRKFLSHLLLIGSIISNLVLLNSILLIFLILFR